MRDKDLEAMLCRMAPLVDSWHFADLPTPRAASARQLEELRAELVRRGQCRGPLAVCASCHASPALALQAALEAADPADRILVFGSFFTVGGVLEAGLPRLAARHVG
jgi:dihydrofolate synthase/folylpolyglutamate synthase